MIIVQHFSEIPQELVRQAQGAEVHVNMVDKRTEEFVPPKPVLRPFSGRYFDLSSINLQYNNLETFTCVESNAS